MYYQSYVYRVFNKITKQFYIGSRTENVIKNRTPEDDLWKYYFTSSKKVKELIETYGIDSFDTEILSKHDRYEECFWEEQRLIIEAKNNSLCLNKTYIDPTTGNKIRSTYNETPEDRKSRIDKMSATKKGKFNSNGHFGMKHTEKTKQKIREAQAKIAYKHTEETKQKMRGRPRSEEHSMKISESKKGKPWTEARRIAQLNKKGNNI